MRLKTTQNYRTLFKGLSLKIFILTIIIFCNQNVFSQNTHNINNPSQLTDAFSATLAPGDIVIFADGTYSSSATMRFNAVGTAANPITLKAATPGGVKFTGGQTLKIGGEYCIIDGFHWKGGNGASNFIEFRDSYNYGNHSTLQNCVVDGLQVAGGTPTYDATKDKYTSVKHNWVVLYGTYNTVINCSFMNKISSGNMILAEYQFNASSDGTSSGTNTRCEVVGHTISNNYFYNYSKIDPTWTNSGDSEAIRIGTSEYQNVNSNNVISNNYFVQADGENEIITNKSKGNSYLNNTFRRCRGSLVLRHGSHTRVDGNYFLGENVDGTGGIRIVDSNQTVTNNYIQDCINVLDQAQWNNGITFLGGNDSSAVPCESTSMSNGYQKVTNLSLNNNTIVNTNAPLYYNNAQGSTDPLGNVTDNLIYFTSGNANITPVINSDYAGLGTALTYTGNVWKGASSLGATNAGFSEQTGITATLNGEIYTFTGAIGKGADMGAYEPTTDAMVGNGIGACFVNNLGVNITDGNCTIVIPESLIVGSLPTLTIVAGSYDVSVTANVGWTAVSNNAWITNVNPASGFGDATVSITVTENTSTESRIGTVNFSQVSGGDDIVRILNVTQQGIELTDLYDLINTGLADDPVTVDSFSKEQGPSHPNPKTNYAINTLDKNNGTVWAADDLETILAGDYFADGEYIIYDLGSKYQLDLIQIATDGKSDSYGLQVWVSTTGNDPSDFTIKVLPTSGDLEFTTANSTAFNQYEITTEVNARYIKLIGYGRFNSARTSRSSIWTNISEIEFYGNASSLSVEEDEFARHIKVYPVPAKGILNIKAEQNNIKSIKLFSIDGRKLIDKTVNVLESVIPVDVSAFSNGTYMLLLINDSGLTHSKLIYISN